MATYTDNYTMTKPTYAEQADISVINANMDIIDNVMHSSQISLAPAYDINETYNTGDIVMHELLMYKCLEDNVTGVWDSTKWTRTTAGEESGGGADLDIYGEASGTAEASFSDGAEASLVKCIVEIEATQSGSGTPSPSNIRPISGHTDVTVTVASTSGGSGEDTTVSLGRTVYGGTLDVTTGVLTVDKGFRTYTGDASENWIYTTSLNRVYINIADAIRPSTYAEIQSNILHYSLPQEDYGSYLNDQGNLIVYAPSTITSASDWKTWLTSNNLQVVYELATPQTFNLTPTQVKTLLGQNYVSHDGGGTISLVYIKKDSTIIPNPSDAEVPLTGLEINGEKFKIESGGYHKALIWDSGSPTVGASYATDYALLDNLSNYNQIILMVSTNSDRADANHQYSYQIWLDVEYLLSSGAWHNANVSGYGTRYFEASFTDSSFRIIQGEGEGGYTPTIFQIYGVRY